jgi:hypothetical protein
MKLSTPDDMDDNDDEQPENNESTASEPTVTVWWETGEMPVSDAVEGHSRMLEGVLNEASNGSEEFDDIVETQAQLIETQRQQIAELYEVIEEILVANGGSVTWDHEP